MKDIERARNIVAGAGATRADIEAAILECKTAAKADEVDLAKMDEGRDAALVAGGEHLKAHKAARADAEERLATRRALVNTLEKRLEETIKRERRAEIEKARAHANRLLKEAADAIADYDTYREKILAMVGKIKASNDFNANFERQFTDEPALPRAEIVARRTHDLDEEIVSEEIVELWAKQDSDMLVDEAIVETIVVSSSDPKRGIIPKSGVSSEHAGGYPVRLRKFRRVAFLPATKAAKPPPLVSDVNLPPLLPETDRREKIRFVLQPDGLLVALTEGIRKAVA